MSSVELSSYLQRRMKELKLSNIEVARRAKISRQTWHRLLKNDMNESKLSTLMGVSQALDIHFMHLLRLHFNHQENSDSAVKHQIMPPVELGLNNHLQMQDERMCHVGESFIKTWRVINLGKKNWQGMKLLCLDPDTRSEAYPNGLCLIAKEREIAIADTKIGESIEVSVQLTAPDTPGRIISDWQIVDNEGNCAAKYGAVLHCIVHVVSI
jgi:transcriptional regulator with XRE-family HTH domain